MSDESPAPPSRLSFATAMLRVGPPWLRRKVGGALMQGIGDNIENGLQRTIDGVRLRFPNVDETALAYLGRERRILRGPGELGVCFSKRLRKWWDSHRVRGNIYALFEQLDAYFEATNPGLEVVYISNTGTADAKLHSSGAITRGGNVTPGWIGDGESATKWARFFLFFQFEGTTYRTVLLDELGEPLLDGFGEPILVTVSLYGLTASDIEEISAVPREWSAAHIDRIYVVCLPANGIAWGFPESLTWGEPGRTWGGDLAITFTI